MLYYPYSTGGNDLTLAYIYIYIYIYMYIYIYIYIYIYNGKHNLELPHYDKYVPGYATNNKNLNLRVHECISTIYNFHESMLYKIIFQKQAQLFFSFHTISQLGTYKEG